MKVRVDINTDCCDDCPFLVYEQYEDICVLSDDELKYPFAFNGIPSSCPLKHTDKIKYSNIKVIDDGEIR